MDRIVIDLDSILSTQQCDRLIKALSDRKFEIFNKGKVPSRDKIYADFLLGNEAFTITLESDSNPTEAILQALDILDREIGEDELRDLKHNNYLHSKKVVDRHKDNDTLKRIINNTSLTVAELKGSDTLYKLLNQAHTNKKTSDRLDKLEEEVKKLNDDNSKLKLETKMSNTGVDKISEVLGNANIIKKEQVRVLLLEGFNMKQISDAVGVSYMTVRRYKEELVENGLL